jgi:hypothetical protein
MKRRHTEEPVLTNDNCPQAFPLRTPLLMGQQFRLPIRYATFALAAVS